MSNPLVSVHSCKDASVVAQVQRPAVFDAPIRPDVINAVHTALNKNKRQPYAVWRHAGEILSANSWGTGRAVARIPRVNASGTSRAGQAAFGNMCRGGRMFAPTKTWRKWHVKMPQAQRRYAVCSAIACSALQGMVKGRGHRVEGIAELPFVVTDDFQSISKTSEAVEIFKVLGLINDVNHIKLSYKLRAGRGKMRNRRWKHRRGPLVIFNEDNGVVRAVRNLGVETCNVNSLNLLQLAPGGHPGRLIVWTQSAFTRLDEILGTAEEYSNVKSGFKIPRNVMGNADFLKIINSEEIQAVCRPSMAKKQRAPLRLNPLRNREQMVKLNPYKKVTEKL